MNLGPFVYRNFADHPEKPKPIHGDNCYTFLSSGNRLLRSNLCITVASLFHRLRPSHPDSGTSALLHLVNGYRGGTYGLPSCHSANSFGLAFFMVFMFRNRTLSTSILLWAVLNSYSRIYMGVHYPSDLIAGLLVGLSGAVLIYCLLDTVFIPNC